VVLLLMLPKQVCLLEQKDIILVVVTNMFVHMSCNVNATMKITFAAVSQIFLI